jgi:hypothetical protein
VLLTKTASRVILGCMNDMAFMCEHGAGRAGGPARLDAGDLDYGLRRNILSARDYQRPIDLTARQAEASRGLPVPLLGAGPLVSLWA